MTAAMHQAFLDDIIAHPEDDTPRLIFADWLEDHGEEERAAAIRYAIWVARANAGDSSNRPPETYWHDDYNELAHKHPTMAFGFSRGFVSFVACSWPSWEQYGPDLVQHHPLERVVLVGKKPRTAVSLGSINPARLGEPIWFWHCEEQSVSLPEHQLPKPIYDTLRKLHPESDNFDSEQAALDALSAACLAWARTEAARRRATP